MIEIPQQLRQNQSLRFLRIYNNSKSPVGEKWSTIGSNTNYSYDELQQSSQTAEGFGILCGTGDPALLIIDVDFKGKNFEEVKKKIETLLPNTFQVKTPKNGRHFYFYINDIKNMTQQYISLINENGEIRGAYTNVLIPPTNLSSGKYEIINDVPIVTSSFNQISTILNEWMPTPRVLVAQKSVNQPIDLNLKDLIDVSQFTKYKNEFRGSHPIHDSQSGQNFYVNFDKNTWKCFRCNSGGGPLQWWAVSKGYVSCADANHSVKGATFKKVIKDIHSELGKTINILEENMFDLKHIKSTLETLVHDIGIYYDTHGFFWLWNEDKFKWEIADETDIMNAIDQYVDYQEKTFLSSIKTMILELLRREGRLNQPQEMCDDLIQFKNTIINIKTMETITADKQYFSKFTIPWNLGNSENTPIIDKLFHEWVSPNDDSVETLYDFVAFSMSPTYFPHRICALIGEGRNGKTTYLSIITKLLGDENVCASDLDELLNNRFASFALYGKLLCWLSETDLSLMKKTGKMKALTGSDNISFEPKGKSTFNGKNTAKLVVAANTLPLSEDLSYAFFSRWLILKFPNTFTEKKDLTHIIPDVEFENLAFKCMNRLSRINKTGEFKNEKAPEFREEEYRKASTPVLQFIEDFCDVGYNKKVQKTLFQEALRHYLEKNQRRALTPHAIAAMLKASGYEIVRENIYAQNNERTTIQVIYGLDLKDTVFDDKKITKKEIQHSKPLSQFDDFNVERQ